MGLLLAAGLDALLNDAPKSGRGKRASSTLGDVVDLRPHPPHHPGMDRRRFLLADGMPSG
jgi:hypothetical protein